MARTVSLIALAKHDEEKRGESSWPSFIQSTLGPACRILGEECCLIGFFCLTIQEE